MMGLPKGFIPPEDTVQVLLEAPGVIKQSDLCRFVDLRNWLMGGATTDAERELFRALRDTLKEHFNAGWLVQMGLVQMYRDHTRVIVISEDPIRAWEFN